MCVESILDGFSTVEITKDDTRWLIQGEVYGDGVDLRIRGTGRTYRVGSG